ncbi:Uncharacterized protein APZ42_031544 [Daphnia magna]|uniref:Uncharacterized protein n=1 Tax=Daphnia magna TaxID=35525 RepID=A0A164MS96_9CRUS|nr:Uncharacterized protein APZ42_031544 [Daphnia magna]
MFKLNIPDEDRVGEMLDDIDCDMWALVIWKADPYEYQCCCVDLKKIFDPEMLSKPNLYREIRVTYL